MVRTLCDATRPRVRRREPDIYAQHVTDLLTALPVLGGIAGVLAVLVLLARHARRRGTAGAAIAGAMAAYDEAVHTTAHDTYVEIQAQQRRTGQTSSPARRRPGDE